MGGYTKNLQLYKADVVENANDTFNIETMLNDNWDKIDEKLEKLPVQNGGLYINSETTEEDKAEAQEALKEIGGFLPLDGSVPMSGTLNVNKTNDPRIQLRNTTTGSVGVINSSDSDYVGFTNYFASNDQTLLKLRRRSTAGLNESLQLVFDNAKAYDIFGKHNKPSGSYTGNGSATSRMIEIGGIGNAVIVICTANSTALIITASGAFGKTGGSTGYFSYDTVHFTNGIITIASTDGSLNASGKNYTYQVL